MGHTMISFSDDNLSSSILSRDELMAICPQSMKTAPTNPNVSNNYVLANTMTVVDDLEKMGWYPVSARQCRAKKNSSGIRSFHMIAFENPNVKIHKVNADGTQEVDAYPRIILTNSHDGFNSFKFMVGLFRCVCSNGLIVASEQFANVAIRHINYTFDELRKVVIKAINEVPNVVNSMNEMKEITLNDNQKNEFAVEAYKIRKNIDENQKVDIDIETIREILKPNRYDDNGNDLWSVFNVIQEKIIKGGFNVINTNTGKSRRQRSVTSIKKDMEYNQKLWSAAMKYMPQPIMA